MKYLLTICLGIFVFCSMSHASLGDGRYVCDFSDFEENTVNLFVQNGQITFPDFQNWGSNLQVQLTPEILKAMSQDFRQKYPAIKMRNASGDSLEIYNGGTSFDDTYFFTLHIIVANGIHYFMENCGKADYSKFTF